MDYIKILTFFDDESDIIASSKILKKYDITLIPSIYQINNKTMIDFLHTSLVDYNKLRMEKQPNIEPTCHESFFIYMYNRISMLGYNAVFVLCPYSKLTPHYKIANKAAKRFISKQQKANIEPISINVIDSKQTGAGLLFEAINFAVKNNMFHYDIETAKYVFTNQAKKSKQYILTREYCGFSNIPTLNAYEIKSKSPKKINISNSVDEIKFDIFSEFIDKEMRKSKKRAYTVSMGCACDFAGNVLGRIKAKTQIAPRSVINYSLISTYLFGTQTICIHLLM